MSVIFEGWGGSRRLSLHAPTILMILLGLKFNDANYFIITC